MKAQDMTVYTTVCRCCGQSAGNTVRRPNPPTTPPARIFGKCPSSSDGKHKPMWTTK